MLRVPHRVRRTTAGVRLLRSAHILLTYPRGVHGTDGIDAEGASSAPDGADGYPEDPAAPSPDDETAPQPVLTPAALAEAAHAHQRPAGVHAGPPAGDDTPADDGVLHHHHEAEGGQASHLAPAHVLPAPRRRWGLVAGVVAAALLVVGGATAFALTRDDSPGTAAPGATPSGSASQSVDVSDVDPTSAPGVGGGEPMLEPGQDTLILGDSLGLTVYPWLADLLPDRYVSYEAEVGRTTSGTINALTQMPESEIPPVVIVSSGTNDPTAAGLQAEASELLDYLGPDRCVVWVDVVRPESDFATMDELNAALDAAVAGRDNVSILRWTDLVEQHTDWLGGDGIHPGQTGAEGRAAAFAAAAESCSALDPDAPVADKQYLPSSVFYGPISGGGSASGSGSGNGGVVQQPQATSQAPAPPAPSSATPAPTKTQDPSPQPSTTSPPKTSAPPPPPASSEPPPPPSSATPQAQGPTPSAS